MRHTENIHIRTLIKIALHVNMQFMANILLDFLFDLDCVKFAVHSFHFTSAVVTVDSSHMTVSSSALWSNFSPPLNFVSGET